MSTDVISSRAMQWASKVQSLADQARDMTLEAAQSVGARYADESKAVDVNKLLEGRTDREKIDGMRRTIAISAKGVDMSEHFASVVKNVASSNLELRKLVYIYIARYAESQPDLALLSINTIQKALSDQNQVVRALALRVISSIRVTSISGIVLLSIKKCMNDSSFYVRKTAAMAIPKTHNLDPSLRSQLVDCLKSLLSDSHPSVLSSSVETFSKICPERVELLHPVYRKLCQTLPQMDEFGQVSVLQVLERYARKCFMSPHIPSSTGNNSENFYETLETSVTTNKDLALLLGAVKPILQSRSSAAVISACRILDTLGSRADAVRIAPSMVAQLRQGPDVHYVVLSVIVVLALKTPSDWIPYAKHFLVYPTEPEHVWRLKLELLTLLTTVGNQDVLLSELAQYSQDITDEKFSKAAIQAIGRCAQHSPEISSRCMEILLNHLRSNAVTMIAESVLAIQQLIQLNPLGHIQHMKVLTKSLESIAAPSARASIFWLVSENLVHLDEIAPDVLRIGVRNFTTEEEAVRIQILSLAVKLYVLHCQHAHEQDVQDMNSAIEKLDEAQGNAEHERDEQSNERGDAVKQDIVSEPVNEELKLMPEIDSPIPKLYSYLCQMVRYDTSYDLRDRFRTYKILVSSPNWILTQKMLFTPKPLPSFKTASAGKEAYSLGSSSLVLGKSFSGYQSLPDWATEVLGQSERDVEVKVPALRNMNHNTSLPPSRPVTPVVTAAMSSATKTRSRLTGISSLDDFYATSSEEESSSEEGDSEEVTTTGDESDLAEDVSEEASSEEGDEDEDGASVEQAEHGLLGKR